MITDHNRRLNRQDDRLLALAAGRHDDAILTRRY